MKKAYTQKERRKEKHSKPKKERNLNSNYSLYYMNDPVFMKDCIRKENPPYMFKIHVIKEKGEDKMKDQEIHALLSDVKWELKF
jgi:hypothetical protein